MLYVLNSCVLLIMVILSCFGSRLLRLFIVVRLVGLFMFISSEFFLFFSIIVWYWWVCIFGNNFIVVGLIVNWLMLIRGIFKWVDNSFSNCCFVISFMVIRVVFSLWLVWCCLVSVVINWGLLIKLFWISRLFRCIFIFMV